jgi:hypothetical protein
MEDFLFVELHLDVSARCRGQLKANILNTFELTSIPSEDKMRCPIHEAKTVGKEALVTKYGKRTGLTFGIANAVRSVRRKPVEQHIFYEYEELCILGAGKIAITRAIFS